MNRRELVRALAWTTCGSCLGAGALALRPPDIETVPVLLTDGEVIPAGGVRIFPAHRVAVYRSIEGLAFLSTTCTHLGCALRLRGRELVCPCHGGRFSLAGAVLAGPPPSPLPWFAGGIAPDGRLYFYPSQPLSDRRPIKV